MTFEEFVSRRYPYLTPVAWPAFSEADMAKSFPEMIEMAHAKGLRIQNIYEDPIRGDWRASVRNADRTATHMVWNAPTWSEALLKAIERAPDATAKAPNAEADLEAELADIL